MRKKTRNYIEKKKKYYIIKKMLKKIKKSVDIVFFLWYI